MIRFEALEAALPGWLETRRWFADKGRGIAGAEIEDALIEVVDGDALVLGIVNVRFSRGDAARYLAPMAWTDQPGGAEIIAPAPFGRRDGAFIDGVGAPWFGHWLIQAMAGNPARGQQGWVFSPYPEAAEILAAAEQAPATIVRAEQSNTSVRYGNTVMVKLVRRLQPGANPDEEMLRALADVGFDRVPPYVGGAFWRAADGETYPIALAQAFVPNRGDGWSWMLRRLHDLPASGPVTALGEGSPEWLLGRRTGELHAALALADAPEFAPERVTATSIDADIRRVRTAVEQTIALLREEAARLPLPLRASLPTIANELRGAISRTEGFRAEAGTRRIRVHGDYHLGQTLRTPDEDWIIIDFEGEPARPVAERRQKTSALKDVSGMLRSFAYARGAVEREELGAADHPQGARLAVWETSARRAFLDGYRGAVRNAAVPLVPEDDEAFSGALAAWELDKALYEIAYEVRNRPDWVALPLRGLLPALSG